MATLTAEYCVIQVARSDGLDTGPGYWPNAVSPSEAAATAAAAAASNKPVKTAKPRSQMIRLDVKDQRLAQWGAELGALLKQELCPTPDGKHHHF
jgi:hypothetical protein